MAYTRTVNDFNSTPFSSCCGVAAMDFEGKPAKTCPKCGGELEYHNDGVPPTPVGVCGMCFKPFKNGPQDEGACNC